MARYLILFDCDGTLVDSQHDIVAAMVYAFSSVGLTPPSREKILAIVGLSVPEAIRELAPQLSGETREVLMRAFRAGGTAQRAAGGRESPLYPGAQETIANLSARDDVVLGVATGKSLRGVQRLFDRLDWHPYFATIQTADTNRSKPDPDMIETAMAEVGVKPTHTFMIGDTTFDMAMAQAAGVTAIGVTWGYHAEQDIVAAGADKVVHSFAELLPAITALRR